MKELSFESVNNEIESLDLGQLELEQNSATFDTDKTSKVCLIWNKIGNIVRLISKIPLLPRKWKKALKLFITTMDSVCS